MKKNLMNRNMNIMKRNFKNKKILSNFDKKINSTIFKENLNKKI